jgi:2-dehydropantoate 2-reductase
LLPGANPPSSPRCAIVGAGAIGAWLADALDRADWRVSVVARGATLEALRTRGLKVSRDGEVRRCDLRAGTPSELGVQEFVFLTVKAQNLPALASQLGPLFHADTVVVSVTNGIPWWFFRNFSGPLENQTLDTVDPGGAQAAAFPGEGVLGSVVHASARVIAPAEVHVLAADRFLLGEPDGSHSARLRDLLAALRAGGIPAESTDRIRYEVWAKLWGNMNMNPLSALTRAGTGVLLADPDVRDLCVRMMAEMQHCGERLDLRVSMSPAERIAITRKLGDFRTSMLADLTAGRELEYAPQLGAVVEIAERLGVPVPYCRSVLGLIRLLSRSLRT